MQYVIIATIREKDSPPVYSAVVLFHWLSSVPSDALVVPQASCKRHAVPVQIAVCPPTDHVLLCVRVHTQHLVCVRSNGVKGDLAPDVPQLDLHLWGPYEGWL
eukprot:4572820-Pyramimonas_sp.AAC.3